MKNKIGHFPRRFGIEKAMDYLSRKNYNVFQSCLISYCYFNNEKSFIHKVTPIKTYNTIQELEGETFEN